MSPEAVSDRRPHGYRSLVAATGKHREADVGSPVRPPDRPVPVPAPSVLPDAGKPGYGWLLVVGAVGAVLLLAMATFVVLSYLVNAPMVGLVVALFGTGAWLVVDVRHRWSDHVAVRRSRSRAERAAASRVPAQAGPAAR